jgi:monoamine oxidase
MEALSRTLDLADPARTPGAADLDAHSVYSWYRSQGASGDAIRLFLDPALDLLVGASAAEINLLGHLAMVRLAGGWAAMTATNAAGAQHQRTRNGNQSLAAFLASKLAPGAVRLSTPVTAVERTDPGVAVTTPAGAFTAAALVVATGTVVLRHIRFAPPLSPLNQLAVERSFNGTYSKFVLVYERPWWAARGLSGLAMMPEGAVRATFDTSDGNSAEGLAPRQYSLTAFLTGPLGAQWSALPAGERRAAVLDQVAAAFGEEARHPTETFEQEWMKDEWARGAPGALLGPGQFLALGAAFMAPEVNMFFAGTDNARDHPGYMEGAVIAGKDAADGVLQYLGEK